MWQDSTNNRAKRIKKGDSPHKALRKGDSPHKKRTEQKALERGDSCNKRKKAEKRDKKKGQSSQKKEAVPLNVPLRLTINTNYICWEVTNAF